MHLLVVVSSRPLVLVRDFLYQSILVSIYYWFHIMVARMASPRHGEIGDSGVGPRDTRTKGVGLKNKTQTVFCMHARHTWPNSEPPPSQGLQVQAGGGDSGSSWSSGASTFETVFH
jgi:hypothetical protein